MKKLVLIVIAFVSCCNVLAQCPFNPTVINGNVALCPSQVDTLATQVATAYQWYKNGNPIIGANQQTLIINQVQDGSANFLVVSTISGCSEPSPSIQVSSINVPTIGFQVLNSPDNTACIGNQIQLDVLPPFETNLRWFRNGVQLSGQFSDSLLAVSSGSYAVSGAIAQCPNTLRLSTTTALTFINAEVPVIVENIQTLSLSTASVAPNYQWYLNDVELPTTNQNSITPLVNGLYKVETVFSQGCNKQSLPYLFNGIIVDCPFDPSISPISLILCPENSDTLSTIVAETYQWYKDGVLIQNATQQQYIVNYFSSAGSNFSVDVTIQECTERSSEVLVDGWVFLPVTVSTLTEIPLDELCEGDSVLLQINQPYVSNITWSKNNVIIENELNDSLLVTNTGVYSVIGFTETCPDFGGESISIDVNFKPAPVPQISFETSTQTVSTTSTNVSVFNWFVDGVLSEQLNSNSFIAPQTADYQLNVEYANGCDATSEPLQVIVTGIQEAVNASIQLYPNPFSDRIQLTSKNQRTVAIELLSSEGKLLFSANFNGYKTIDTTILSPGLYLLRVTQEGKSFTYKLVK